MSALKVKFSVFRRKWFVFGTPDATQCAAAIRFGDSQTRAPDATTGRLCDMPSRRLVSLVTVADGLDSS